MLPEKAKAILSEASDRMEEAVAYLEEDLKTYRVGKANPSILNDVRIDYYGVSTPLPQAASVSAPDAKTLLVQPWDRSLLNTITKAIQDANLGFTPSNNGEVIRCAIPALTEETRKELIKKAKAAGESAKVVVRGARRDAVDALKKAQKNGSEITEDAEAEGEEEVQKLTDKFTKEIDNLVAAKEKDMMTV